LPACVQSSSESVRATATPSTATANAVTSLPPSANTEGLPRTGFALLGARWVVPGTRQSHASAKGCACTAPFGSGTSLVRLASAS
jgi:hypothetical protein